MRVIVSSWFITFGILAGVSPAASQAAPRDSATTPRTDSVRPAVDSAPVAPAAAPAPAAPVPAAPVDPALRTACGPLQAPSLAPNLLVIVFGLEVDETARAAVASSVDGKLLEPTGSGEGSYYLKVPAEGSDYLLQAITDRLIRRPEVRQVGTKLCPPQPAVLPGPPPDTAKPK